MVSITSRGNHSDSCLLTISSFTRARAFIDIGEPIRIDNEWVCRYNHGGTDRFDAVNEFLSVINEDMYTVTTMAQDWDTMNAVREW